MNKYELHIWEEIGGTLIVEANSRQEAIEEGERLVAEHEIADIPDINIKFRDNEVTGVEVKDD